MKKTLLLAVTLFVSLSMWAQDNKGVNFLDIPFHEALRKAQGKKSPKMIFMDCYAVWCGPCKYMANTIFPMEEAGNYFNAKFVNVKYDMEKGEGKDLAKKYGVRAYPTFLILDNLGNEIGRIVGSSTELSEFIARVEKAMDPNASPSHLKAVFEKEGSASAAANYLKALEEAYKKDDQNTFMKENWEKFEANDLFGNDLWPFFNSYIGTDSKALDFLIENKMTAVEIIGKDKVDKVLVNFYSGQLAKWGVGKKEMTNEEVLVTIDKMQALMQADDTLNRQLAEIVRMMVQGETEKLNEYLDYRRLSYYFTAGQLASIERLLTGPKGVSQDTAKAYYKAKAEYHTKQAEAAQKLAQ